MSEEATRTIYSIGHSNHSLDKFFGLLAEHGIEVLVDVRSQPYSKYTTHFNKAEIKQAVAEHGLKYLFLGKELGGRPDNPDLYDESDGHVDYTQVATSPLFLEGIERLEKGSEKYRVAIMCSEEKPQNCHRHLLIGRVLVERGNRVLHLRADGSTQSQHEVANQIKSSNPDYVQPKLILDEEITEWKSTRSVLPKKARKNSSGS